MPLFRTVRPLKLTGFDLQSVSSLFLDVFSVAARTDDFIDFFHYPQATDFGH